MPLWSSMGKPGDLGDHPGDKIRADSDQGPEIRRICQLDLWDCCVLSPFILFLMPSHYASPFVYLSDLCI